jgi:hypothetical protein
MGSSLFTTVGCGRRRTGRTAARGASPLGVPVEAPLSASLLCHDKGESPALKLLDAVHSEARALSQLSAVFPSRPLALSAWASESARGLATESV